MPAEAAECIVDGLVAMERKEDANGPAPALKRGPPDSWLSPIITPPLAADEFISTLWPGEIVFHGWLVVAVWPRRLDSPSSNAPERKPAPAADVVARCLPYVDTTPALVRASSRPILMSIFGSAPYDRDAVTSPGL